LTRDNLLIKRNVDNRIVVDAAFFRQINPNYARLKVEKTWIEFTRQKSRPRVPPLAIFMPGRLLTLLTVTKPISLGGAHYGGTAKGARISRSWGSMSVAS
jgi:hypothetical protein